MTRDKMLALLWPDADEERGPRTLAQALYALRKNLGAEDAITGTKDLRLDPALVTSDVSEFASAVSRGDHERAVAAYGGSFLDGFHLSAAEDFSRWAEHEREAIKADYARSLESLARGARAAGDPRASVAWWRKLAAVEPLNGRVAVGLMEALAESGDRTGALQHAHVYEVLVEQELDLPPDREVVALAQRLREDDNGVVAAPPPTPAVGEALGTLEQSTPGRAAESHASPAEPVGAGSVGPARRRLNRLWLMGGALAVAASVLLVARSLTRSASSSGGRVVAIGNIRSFGTDSIPSGLTAPVTDLLTTNLARVRSIRVVSRGRMLEVMHALASETDTSSGTLVNAARQAGATEIIDGTLYARPGGRLRLDLRRVDIATGSIGDAYTVEGSDVFALVDSGTARLVESLGATAPTGSVADVTTRSVTAYRMYEQGVRAYYRGEASTALRFFDSALAEDSLFALAAYYAALSDQGVDRVMARLERARRLAARASDRERLIILAGWAGTVSSPSLRAIAETLATRYPTEVQGHLYTGIARVLDGEFLDAIAPLERAVAMDSLGIRGTRPQCSACDALAWMISSYVLADSLQAAERVARRWVRLQPTSDPAIGSVVGALELQGKSREADSLYTTVRSPERSYARTVEYRALHLIRTGEYAAADSFLRAQLREANPERQADVLWDLTMSLREQGRLTEALDAARKSRAPLALLAGTMTGVLPITVLEPQVLLEMGRPAAAAVLYDSIAQHQATSATVSQRMRNTAWMLTQVASARAAAGDTASLGRLADSIRTLGDGSGYGRDRRLYHHVRGLLAMARGDDRTAIQELRAAIYSLPAGYTRTNYELARVYLRDKRPNDAIAVLQPVLRGALDASNLYLNRIELQERLAEAWDAAGGRDSAAAHYEVVARAWGSGDPPFKARADRARRREAELSRRDGR
jgi:DNA-binding SARP family transcriptional activator/TolB-like protein